MYNVRKVFLPLGLSRQLWNTYEIQCTFEGTGGGAGTGRAKPCLVDGLASKLLLPAKELLVYRSFKL